MKINLTKLLESPTRIKMIGENNTNTPAEIISNENTSPNRTYSFELEKETFYLEEQQRIRYERAKTERNH